MSFDESGTALVSGFSPSTLQHILAGNVSPERQVRAVLDSDRYKEIETVQL